MDLQIYLRWCISLLLLAIVVLAVWWNVASCGQTRQRGDGHCPGCLQHYHAP